MPEIDQPQPWDAWSRRPYVVELARQCALALRATTAMRISEASGLEARYVDLSNGIIRVEWQLYPGKGGLVRKRTKGRRRREVPIIEPLVPTWSP